MRLYRVIPWGLINEFMNYRIIPRAGSMMRPGQVLPETTIHSIYNSAWYYQSDMTVSQACKPVAAQLSFEICAATALMDSATVTAAGIIHCVHTLCTGGSSFCEGLDQ